MLSAEEKGIPVQESLEVKKIVISKGIVEDGTVFYLVQIQGSYNTWTISKRYSQFETLFNELLATHAEYIPAGTDLPAKKLKLFTSHVSVGFIEERRVLLESFIKKLASVGEIASSAPFISFITTNKTENNTSTLYDEKKQIEEELPDDVEVTGVSIAATRTMSDHILYQIDVENCRMRKSYSKWTVLKRFGQFYDMDVAVREELASLPHILEQLPQPPRRKVKLLNDHMDEAFVEQRRVLLENYLVKMLKHVEVVRSQEFLKFLGVN